MILAFGRIRRIRPILRKLPGRFIDDPDFAIRNGRQAGKIGLGDSPQGNAIKSGSVLRKFNRQHRCQLIRRGSLCQDPAIRRRHEFADGSQVSARSEYCRSAACPAQKSELTRDRLLPPSDRTGCCRKQRKYAGKASGSSFRHNLICRRFRALPLRRCSKARG